MKITGASLEAAGSPICAPSPARFPLRSLTFQRVVTVFLPRCEECPNCRTGGKLPRNVGTESNGAGTLPGGSTRLTRAGQPVRHHLGVSGFATHAAPNRRSVVPVGGDVPPS